MYTTLFAAATLLTTLYTLYGRNLLTLFLPTRQVPRAQARGCDEVV